MCSWRANVALLQRRASLHQLARRRTRARAWSLWRARSLFEARLMHHIQRFVRWRALFALSTRARAAVGLVALLEKAQAAHEAFKHARMHRALFCARLWSRCAIDLSPLECTIRGAWKLPCAR